MSNLINNKRVVYGIFISRLVSRSTNINDIYGNPAMCHISFIFHSVRMVFFVKSNIEIVARFSIIGWTKGARLSIIFKKTGKFKFIPFHHFTSFRVILDKNRYKKFYDYYDEIDIVYNGLQYSFYEVHLMDDVIMFYYDCFYCVVRPHIVCNMWGWSYKNYFIETLKQNFFFEDIRIVKNKYGTRI